MNLICFGKKLYGIEVKSGRKQKRTGLSKFKEKFPLAELMMVTPDNFEHFAKELT